MMGLKSWAWFDGPVQKAILQLKYGGDIPLGEVLSRPLIRILRQSCWPIELVTPVPAGVAHQAKRGYNQAALLAWPVARGSALEYNSTALIKVRETRSQVGLNRLERRQNVDMAFQAKSAQVAGKKILVIDDVATSGATLLACTDALYQAGADQVYGLTLARARFSGMDHHTQTEVQYDSASGNL
jgi:ComF family protein